MPALTTTVDKKGHPVGGITKAASHAMTVDKHDPLPSSSSSSSGSERGRHKARPIDEVAEWEARDDLRAWTVPSVTVEGEAEI